MFEDEEDSGGVYGLSGDAGGYQPFQPVVPIQEQVSRPVAAGRPKPVGVGKKSSQKKKGGVGRLIADIVAGIVSVLSVWGLYVGLSAFVKALKANAPAPDWTIYPLVFGILGVVIGGAYWLERVVGEKKAESYYEAAGWLRVVGKVFRVFFGG